MDGDTVMVKRRLGHTLLTFVREVTKECFSKQLAMFWTTQKHTVVLLSVEFRTLENGVAFRQNRW